MLPVLCCRALKPITINLIAMSITTTTTTTTTLAITLTITITIIAILTVCKPSVKTWGCCLAPIGPLANSHALLRAFLFLLATLLS